MQLIIEYSNQKSRMIQVEPNGAVHVLTQWARSTKKQAEKQAKDYEATFKDHDMTQWSDPRLSCAR